MILKYMYSSRVRKVSLCLRGWNSYRTTSNKHLKKVDQFFSTQKREYYGKRDSFDVVQMITENKNRAENEPTKEKIKQTKNWNWIINGYSWIEEKNVMNWRSRKNSRFDAAWCLGHCIHAAHFIISFGILSILAERHLLQSIQSLNEWDAPATISIYYSFCLVSKEVPHRTTSQSFELMKWLMEFSSITRKLNYRILELKNIRTIFRSIHQLSMISSYGKGVKNKTQPSRLIELSRTL